MVSASQRPVLATGDVRLGAASFAGQLDSGETLAGTPTVVEQATSDLTITSPVVSTAVLKINGARVAAGAAVQFKISGQKISGSPYKAADARATDLWGKMADGHIRDVSAGYRILEYEYACPVQWTLAGNRAHWAVDEDAMQWTLSKDD